MCASFTVALPSDFGQIEKMFDIVPEGPGDEDKLDNSKN